MKQSLLWMRLCLKRLLLRPLFFVSLLILPVLTVGMRMEMKKAHAIVQVGILCEDSTDAVAGELLERLLELSGPAVLFVEYAGEEILYRDVTQGTIQAGYVIPSGLREKLTEGAVSGKPIIRTVRRETELTLKIVDELVLCRVYEYLAYDICREYVEKRAAQDPASFLKGRYDIYRQKEMPFVFQYESGEENKVLSGESGDYLLLPIQGMVAVLVLLAAMSGAVFWYEDKMRNVFVWLSVRMQTWVHLIYIFVPGVCAGVIGYVSLLATGISAGAGREAVRMLLYVPALTLFIYILQMLLRKETFFLASIPVLTIGELLVCPVFMDFAKAVPAVKWLRMLTPVNFYMEFAYSVQGRLAFLYYFVGSVLLAGILTLAYRRKV